jgi:hypothetical protein
MPRLGARSLYSLIASLRDVSCAFPALQRLAFSLRPMNRVFACGVRQHHIGRERASALKIAVEEHLRLDAVYVTVVAQFAAIAIAPDDELEQEFAGLRLAVRRLGFVACQEGGVGAHGRHPTPVGDSAGQ